MDFKKLVVRFFFFLEVLFFSYYYLFGAQGLQAIMRLREQNSTLKRELATIKHAVQAAENELEQWHSHPFNKEKFIREHLLMAYPNELLYRYPE